MLLHSKGAYAGLSKYFKYFKSDTSNHIYSLSFHNIFIQIQLF